MTTPVFCAKCGAEVRGSFCTNCGTRVSAPAAAPGAADAGSTTVVNRDDLSQFSRQQAESEAASQPPPEVPAESPQWGTPAGSTSGWTPTSAPEQTQRTTPPSYGGPAA